MKKLLHDLQPWLPLISTAIGTFLGAFLGFFISQMNERVKRNRERWREHGNALVHLERRLNGILAIVADNKNIAKRTHVSESNSEKGIPVVWSEPNTLPMDSPHLIPLLRIDILNELFSLNQSIRKLNSDTKMICRAYGEMRSALLRQDINRDQYLSSLNEYRNKIGILDKAYGLINNKTMTLLTRTRVAIKIDTLRKKSIFFKLPTPIDIPDDEIKRELGILEQEISEVRSKSREDINQYLK